MIKSNFEKAEQIATKMENASDSVQNAASKSYSTDEKTTVEVNLAAQEANDKTFQLANHFQQLFLRTIEDIHSVADKFDWTDQELDKSINELLPDSNVIKNINTYNKAKDG